MPVLVKPSSWPQCLISYPTLLPFWKVLFPEVPPGPVALSRYEG